MDKTAFIDNYVEQALKEPVAHHLKSRPWSTVDDEIKRLLRSFTEAYSLEELRLLVLARDREVAGLGRALHADALIALKESAVIDMAERRPE